MLGYCRVVHETRHEHTMSSTDGKTARQEKLQRIYVLPDYSAIKHLPPHGLKKYTVIIYQDERGRYSSSQ